MGKVLALIPSNYGRQSVGYALRDGDVQVSSASDALVLLNEEEFELLLIFPGEIGIQRDAFIRRALSKDPLLGVVLIGEPFPASSITETFVDLFLPEDASPEHITGSVERVIETRRLQLECNLVGKSPELRAIAELIFRVAPTDLPVLIIGESGTGKELVAQAIHRHSNRSNGPFLPINAAAIPEGTLESELFGHEKGSFTGASTRHTGYFEQADNGTAFLDEVAELPLPVQAKLLRVIETGDLMRVGGTGHIHVDVRLIAATNSDLTVKTSKGDFREDLYYRLAAVKIAIPPLRERPKDIPVLVYKFVSEIRANTEKVIGGISETAIARMMKYHWPGNVRELRNLVENAVILAGERAVAPQDIESYFEDHAQMGRRLPVVAESLPTEDQRIGAALAMLISELRALRLRVDELAERLDSIAAYDPESAERIRIQTALRDNDYDKAAAAKSLGMSLRTLYRRLKRYDLNPAK